MLQLPKDIVGLVQSYFTLRDHVEDFAYHHMLGLEDRHGCDLFNVKSGQTLFSALLTQTYDCRKCGKWEHVSKKKETCDFGYCKTCFENVELRQCFNCDAYDTWLERCTECGGHFCEICAANCFVATCECCGRPLCDACA